MRGHWQLRQDFKEFLQSAPDVDPAQAEALERWLSQLVDGYGDRIVPITVRIAGAWGRLDIPDPVPVVDGLLAATALVHDWTLVTRNVTDVASTGVRLLDPFTGDA